SSMFQQIATDIQTRCGGKLEAVVASHRHADHINGFAFDNEGDSGHIIRQCSPSRVLQPWTEDPQAPEDPAAASLLNHLRILHRYSWRLRGSELLHLLGLRTCSEDVLREIRRFSANNAWTRDDPANLSAVKNLREMSASPLYLSYGQPANLDLPGVDIQVLGPPTLQQSLEILKQRATHPAEFWQLLDAPGSVDARTEPLFDSRSTRVSEWVPQQVRWLIRRLNVLRGQQVLEMVRVLDDVLNNTSLILLFVVGDKKLLFPGDAQWENWSYALKHTDHELLKGATLYKVGHHGSRNATPKSLWNLIKGEDLQSVLSTKAGRHGRVKDKTEVPRAALVAELKKHHFFSTQELGWSDSADDEPPSEVFTFTPK